MKKLNASNARWSGEDSRPGNAFWEDVYRLTFDFLSSFSPDHSGTVHLKKVDSNECSKYHTDGYSLRLFTTYYGSGTEWLPEKAVHRAGLGKSNEKILKDPSQIQRMDPFEVGILKGELPNKMNRTPGIVHRSPEIELHAEKRIILRVDL